MGLTDARLPTRLTPQEVRVAPISPERLREVLDRRTGGVRGASRRAVEVFEGRVIWNVNSTAAGGGVAEMLRSFLAYSRGAGVDVRWMVIEGTPEFFRITKRLHNFLHGAPGDGGELGDGEARVYEAVCERRTPSTSRRSCGPSDVVLLHDPQTAGARAAR